MKSLIATALLLCPQAGASRDGVGFEIPEEASLMQGLKAHYSLSGASVSDSTEGRKDATARLMETATKMLKNGATPDVVQFIEETIAEVNENVLGTIVAEHHRDQNRVNDYLDQIDAAIALMQACADSLENHVTERSQASLAHRTCRSEESVHCARSRKCEADLEQLWSTVKIEEAEMRRIHNGIHSQWCVAPPQHPLLANPFAWEPTRESEGPETSQSEDPYPIVDLAQDVRDFRSFSYTEFDRYIQKKPEVELAWNNYNQKLLECADLEETLEAKVETCDDLQVTLHRDACGHVADQRQCVSSGGHRYYMDLESYNLGIEAIRQLENDRKREWETLHIVTCLLETVYTHVIHSIDSGDPCPTEESNPTQTEAEINYCHVIDESMTANLTIDYGEPPAPPHIPEFVPPPCSAQYIWDEHGAFPETAQTTHTQDILDEGLGAYFTALSAHGWGGCAAPLACTPCSGEVSQEPDEEYTASSGSTPPADLSCMPWQNHLQPGQMDTDSFKCLTGDQCIHSSGRCNGVPNCDDDSDETSCDTSWGDAAVLHREECHDPLVSDVQFHCPNVPWCVPIEAKCNGVNNCGDNSDETNCGAAMTSVALEPATGFTATIETPALQSTVFTDRAYTFDSLGSFTGHSYVKMANDDKLTRQSHIQMKLRLPQPTTIYVVRRGVSIRDGLEEQDESSLPWLEQDGWAISSLTGVSYRGARQTRHTEWSGDLTEDAYGPGAVWQKTFPAGTVEMRGNNGADGSYLIFLANPAANNVPTPTTTLWTQHMPDAGPVKCNRNVDVQFVADQAACQQLATDNGHPFYSFRHNANNRGHKCMSSATCDSPLLMRRNEWYVYTTVNVAAHHYGVPSGNTCLTSAVSSDVSEADCLAAVQELLPMGQAQGRTNLVAGSWGWVPPGCSVQSHFTHGQNGDWAAHYNRNSGGQNDGGYTPVCVASTPSFTVAQENTKCPHQHGDRLFREPSGGSNAITLAQCYAQCAVTSGCEHFSWGAWSGGYVCMGCTTSANAETHDGFTLYDMTSFN